MADLFKIYLEKVYKTIQKGDAREESFYSALEELFEKYGQSIKKKTDVTTLPIKTEAGNPDFRIWDGQNEITGYIEAKAPTTENLESIEQTEQLQRYLEAFPNVILTNFFEFRLYREGQLFGKPVKISDIVFSRKIPRPVVVQKEVEIKKLLNNFFDFAQPKIKTSKILSKNLAIKTSMMRDYVILPLLEEEKNEYFISLFNSFKNYLIKDLTHKRFADYFSQTFTYGLLIAKYQYEKEEKSTNFPFMTKTAYDYIQKKFGILRDVFKVISTEDLPKDS